MSAIPIKVVKVLGSGPIQPAARRLPEDASQTFLSGVPVYVDSTGYLAVVAAITASGSVIAGFSSEPAHNLTSDGVAKTLTYGSVENQANAVLIPVGAPPSDGACGVWIADDLTIFVGKTLSTHALAVTDVGLIYGLTADTNGQWFVDTAITTVNGGAVVEVTELIDAVGTLGGKVAFRVLRANQQLVS